MSFECKRNRYDIHSLTQATLYLLVHTAVVLTPSALLTLGYLPASCLLEKVRLAAR